MRRGASKEVVKEIEEPLKPQYQYSKSLLGHIYTNECGVQTSQPIANNVRVLYVTHVGKPSICKTSKN